MYIQHNIQVHSCNHCCSGKAIGITYSESAFVTLGIQHAMHMRHSAICGVSSSTIFYYIVIKSTIKKKYY